MFKDNFGEGTSTLQKRNQHEKWRLDLPPLLSKAPLEGSMGVAACFTGKVTNGLNKKNIPQRKGKSPEGKLTCKEI